MLAILEDVGDYVCLIEARACTANFAAKQLVAWCAAFGTSKIWVSENGTHFRNRMIRKVASAALKVQHRFGRVTMSARTNGAVERMMAGGHCHGKGNAS